MSDIYRAAEAGLVTLLGLLDLSAAFDTVDHVILLDWLQHCYGISGHVLRWIESYQTGRYQFVRFNGETSGTTMVTSGVPQESVLGLILYIAYSAEVIGIVEQHGFNVHAFADDLQVYGHAMQARSCCPGYAGCLRVHRERQGLDGFQPTPSQPFKDGADMVGLQPSSASLQQYRNEGVGRRSSTHWLCPLSGGSHRQWDDAGEARQLHLRCLLLPAPTTANHPSIPHHGRCSCSGTGAHTHPYWLLQRASRLLSALPDWQTTGSYPRGRQAGTATTFPVFRVGNHASTVTLVGCVGPGELQDRPHRLQMLPWSSSRLPIRSVRSGFQLLPVATTCVHPRRWTDYCTSHEPKPRHWAHEGFITPHLPCGTRSRWICVIPDSRSTPLEQNWNLTFSQLIDFFSVVHLCTLFCSLFAVRANVMFISWRVQMSELNWIELNVIYPIEKAPPLPTRVFSDIPDKNWLSRLGCTRVKERRTFLKNN